MIRTARLCCLLLAGIVGFVPTEGRADEWATWQSLNLKYLDTRKLDLVFYSDWRSSLDPSRFGGYLASQQVKFELHPNLIGGVNYTFLSLPTKHSDELIETHRAECEVVPHFKVDDWLEIAARQRFELPWPEGHGGPSERTRHRIQLDFPIQHAGRLRSAFVYEEVFYDFEQHRVTENRLAPAGLSFRLAEKSSLSVFYTWQTVHTAGTRYERHIVNTALSVSL